MKLCRGTKSIHAAACNPCHVSCCHRHHNPARPDKKTSQVPLPRGWYLPLPREWQGCQAGQLAVGSFGSDPPIPQPDLRDTCDRQDNKVKQGRSYMRGTRRVVDGVTQYSNAGGGSSHTLLALPRRFISYPSGFKFGTNHACALVAASACSAEGSLQVSHTQRCSSMLPTGSSPWMLPPKSTAGPVSPIWQNPTVRILQRCHLSMPPLTLAAHS